MSSDMETPGGGVTALRPYDMLDSGGCLADECPVEVGDHGKQRGNAALKQKTLSRTRKATAPLARSNSTPSKSRLGTPRASDREGKENGGADDDSLAAAGDAAEGGGKLLGEDTAQPLVPTTPAPAKSGTMAPAPTPAVMDGKSGGVDISEVGEMLKAEAAVAPEDAEQVGTMCDVSLDEPQRMAADPVEGGVGEVHEEEREEKRGWFAKLFGGLCGTGQAR